MNDVLTLHTGACMPAVGLGTWKLPPEEALKTVSYALSECGYRHVDCAAIYRSEREIGPAFAGVFADGDVTRGEVFVTSKLWMTEFAKKDVEPACRHTLKNLQLSYLDLYLMHWGIAARSDPTGPMPVRNAREEALDEHGGLVPAKVSVRETWEAMEALVRKGLVRAIGVSNFTAPMLVDLLSYARIPPAVNQIELHPYNQQTALVEF